MKYLTLICIILTSQVNAKDLNLTVSKDGKFDILYHRFESTVAGALLGGVIGATIEEGVRKGKDVKKKKVIINLLSDTTCKKRLIDSFVNKLKMNDYNIIQENDRKKNKKSKLWLNIDIIKCGFKMVNSSTKEVSAFVELKTIIRNKNKIITKKRLSIKAKKQYSFQELKSNKETINEELKLVLIKAGQRLANKIIYQR